MISIRYISAGLVFLLSIVNFYLGIIDANNSTFLKYIFFFIIYFALGIFLIRNNRFSGLAGFIIPFALLFIYPAIVDFNNLHPWSSGALAGMDALVIICCFILLMLRL